MINEFDLALNLILYFSFGLMFLIVLLLGYIAYQEMGFKKQIEKSMKENGVFDYETSTKI